MYISLTLTRLAQKSETSGEGCSCRERAVACTMPGMRVDKRLQMRVHTG